MEGMVRMERMDGIKRWKDHGRDRRNGRDGWDEKDGGIKRWKEWKRWKEMKRYGSGGKGWKFMEINGMWLKGAESSMGKRVLLQLC